MASFSLLHRFLCFRDTRSPHIQGRSFSLKMRTVESSVTLVGLPVYQSTQHAPYDSDITYSWLFIAARFILTTLFHIWIFNKIRVKIITLLCIAISGGISIIEITPKCRYGVQYYCLLSEERNPVRKNRQQILIQGASVNRAILRHMFFSGSATLGRMPLSPFCCQL